MNIEQLKEILIDRDDVDEIIEVLRLTTEDLVDVLEEMLEENIDAFEYLKYGLGNDS